MSRGISTIEFVRQVYYAQEKVYLDFVPTDDKFKEVLLEANFVLQELQKEEDWNWLRTQCKLGLTLPDTRYFPVPEDFYKVSTTFNDALRLYAHRPHCIDTGCPNSDPDIQPSNYDYSQCTGKCFDRAPFILVPFVPIGWQNDFAQRQMSYITRPNVQDITLGATVVNDGDGEKIIFSRPLLVPEINRVVVLQYQRLLEPFHICNDGCVGVHGGDVSYDPTDFNPCDQLYYLKNGIETPILKLTEIPDYLYVIIRTAQYHAEGSPPAQGRIAGLQDQSQKLLSSMRENNAAATQVDFIPSWNPGFWQIV